LLGVSLLGDAVLDGWCFARFLDAVLDGLVLCALSFRIFQARNGREVISSEKCLVGQVASVAGAAGAAVSRRCGVGVGTALWEEES